MAPCKRPRIERCDHALPQAQAQSRVLLVRHEAEVVSGARESLKPRFVSGQQPWQLNLSIYDECWIVGLSPLDLAGAVLSWEALKDSLWWAASLTLTVQLADSTTVHGPFRVCELDMRGHKAIPRLCGECEDLPLADADPAARKRRLAATAELHVPVPEDSVSGDMLLATADGAVVVPAHSQLLGMHSAVLGGLFDEVQEALHESGQLLAVPLPDVSAIELHMLLQVCYTKNLDTLLAGWHLMELWTLSLLADRLAFKPALCKAIDDALATKCCLHQLSIDFGKRPCTRVAQDFLEHCLPWAQRVGYKRLEGAVLAPYSSSWHKL